MTKFEVHYQKGEEFGEAVVEAEYPEQACQKFMQDNYEKDLVVLCVVRQNLGA